MPSQDARVLSSLQGTQVTFTMSPFGTGMGKAEEQCQVTAQLYRPVNVAQLPSLHEQQSCCGV